MRVPDLEGVTESQHRIGEDSQSNECLFLPDSPIDNDGGCKTFGAAPAAIRSTFCPFVPARIAFLARLIMLGMLASGEVAP